ncbi:MAG: hypothetical protein A2487_06115 [Candidatus Raymondbacteria bacterium RifOxyC12_full_50_8]|uniref:DUF5723 domain-containing protein n=1 Tax=Candidatus Raymondbacteria bacterium RIFOXYD12_FULL_49_13 TaxID=1817890 RepID=A0A1F7F9D7_UNCRA|nr:MAG: hypothetical protein A2248_18630 [Candidatus Raymondbacteria bacterium RIFOXYA2_FULL_49_16]OGJ98593.1 MAG: hypothetical protein A2350_14155 [Candidatus Raymondbacteria bacterium RifOxyB12_full_50_8]OGJ99477.1 MAG: hypothetical protein A2487_06115 [Candidatus Raymondbacteria bacterium RifOxyC12_full_50_8]OGK03265.1 MAG: hypothetical protein A2519_13135 [Candidatus Raymondbacteria bacterium RIFOXYD12_FULL_49_13]OGP41538.1 MAG: hypothetical protein A2324_09655 [Candidatus Raymondbacteria b
MKKTVCVLAVVLIGAAALFATNARVESMGKSATFFMDDVSIFENPANINIYPNFLIGEPGRITEFSDSNTNYKNQDPAEPFGGGILAFSLNKDKNAETRYPMLTLGAIMNHQNELVDVLMGAARANVDALHPDGHIIPKPVVPNSDFFIGYTLDNGVMLGGHFYATKQTIDVPFKDLNNSKQELIDAGILTATDSSGMAYDSLMLLNASEKTGDMSWSSGVYRGDLGVNMPVSQNMDLEVSLGIAIMQYSGNKSVELGKYAIPDYNDQDLSIFASARLFSTLVSLNGELVPVVKYKHVAIRNYTKNEVIGGIGANVTLDRGFFWAGTEVNWSNTESPKQNGRLKDISALNIPLSFGIERNVVWDWLVLRVGFRKILWGSYSNQSDLTMLKTNPEADMTASDHVGGGIGLNIEEKLKIDCVVAEDFLYKFGNLISGNSHHVFSRITATYSF